MRTAAFSCPPRATSAGAAGRAVSGRPVPEPTDVPARVDQIRGLALVEVTGDDQRRLWNELMAREHPRGAARHVGAQVRYLLVYAYWGGQRRGGKRGRGAAGKTPFVAAVEVTVDGRPHKLRMCRVKGFRKAALRQWARRHLKPSTPVQSDGLACFRSVVEAGCEHLPTVTGGGPGSCDEPRLTWVNTMPGNVKRSIDGTYHAIDAKHLPRYLAEFSYRFNRRYQLANLVPRLVHASANTPPMPYRLLELDESYG